MENWFEQAVCGRYAADKERRFFAAQFRPWSDCVAVKIGAPWLMPSEKNVISVSEDIAMRPESLALADQSVDWLLMAHAHEYASQPLQVLAEAARVLKPEGRLVLSGFNPQSLWGLGRWFDGERLPLREHCLTLPAIKRQLRTLGLEIEYGKFMVYVPPVSGARALSFWQFMEKAGDRWWPQHAAVYGLVLVKRMAGVHPLPQLEIETGHLPVALGLARTNGE